jgi:branched-chain amino acid transport system permease protein
LASQKNWKRGFKVVVSYRKERLDRGIKARSDDIFVISSHRETLYLVLPRIIPIVGILLIPLLKENVGIYWEKVLVITCIISLLSLSWDLLMSVGLVSLGQAFFFGTGAYFAGFLNKSFNWSPLFTIPIATLGGGAFCAILLLPVLRLRGIYFSLITLALPILFMRIIEAGKILGGEEGIVALTPFHSIWIELYVPAIALLFCLFGFRRLINTDYGIVLRGIRDNDRAVMARGINIYWYKTQVVFIAGAVGAFAGAFLTHYYQFAGTSGLGLDYSILPLTCAIVGGSGTFAGAVLGTFILVPLAEILRAFGTLRVVFYSLILLAFVVVLPEGIFDYLQRKYHQYERLASVEVGK